MKRIALLAGLVALVAAAGAAAELPAVDAPAPEFRLNDHEGNEVSLEEFRGQWLVLYFYPKDFTSGCTIEARGFQRDLAKYEELDAAIVGVSVDDVDSHKRFCEAEGLEFTLLSDPDAVVSTAYGAVIEHEGKTYSARKTFVIDPAGRLVRVFERISPSGHSEEVLETLAKLRSR